MGRNTPWHRVSSRQRICHLYVTGRPSESSGPIYIDRARSGMVRAHRGRPELDAGESDGKRKQRSAQPGCGLFDRGKQKRSLDREAAGRTHQPALYRPVVGGQDLHRARWAGTKQCLHGSPKSVMERFGREPLSGGVSRLKDGKFTTYTVADGLGGQLRSIRSKMPRPAPCGLAPRAA